MTRALYSPNFKRKINGAFAFELFTTSIVDKLLATQRSNLVEAQGHLCYRVSYIHHVSCRARRISESKGAVFLEGDAK
jgi:hypothetical protein